MLFGKKKPESCTILLLDIESGSVGSALVRLEEGDAPKLFGETRLNFKVSPTRDSLSILNEAQRHIEQALAQVAEIASRLRNVSASSHVRNAGSISRAAVFLAAPWGAPNLGAGEPSFIEPMSERAGRAIDAAFGAVPFGLHTAAGGAFDAVRHLVPFDDSYVLCLVSAELTEVLLVAGDKVAGYATVPRGRHTLVRTLRTHAGMSEHEARSALQLTSTAYAEPLSAAAHEYAQDIADTIEELLNQSPLAVSRVYVAAHGAGRGTSEWFAQSLAASERMGELLPDGSVRALGVQHAAPHLSAHAEEPDFMLMLQTIFVGAQL